MQHSGKRRTPAGRVTLFGMRGTKTELVVFQKDRSTRGYSLLHDLDITSPNGAVAIEHTPHIGELLVLDIPSVRCAGRVCDRTVIYSDKDLRGVEWDFVTRIFLMLDEDLPTTQVRSIIA